METAPGRRADHTERFVAFAFAAADMVMEIGGEDRITYAAGAFRARLGEEPDAFLGRKVHSVFTGADQTALESALMLLRERGRLTPTMLRLATPATQPFALAGLALGPNRFCVTLAQPPTPPDNRATVSSAEFQKLSVARVRTEAPCDIGFIELADPAAMSSDAVQEAVRAVCPEAVASELAPGRYGLLGSGRLPDVLRLLEESLGSSGGALRTQHLAAQREGLTSTQAARVLGQALIVFARSGRNGLEQAGFAGGLAGYVDKAVIHTAALRRAIQDRKFELLYQPIRSFQGRELHRFEALLRPKPIRGCDVGATQEFVMLVETLGLAAELDLAVAETAAAAAARAPAPIAFNISGQSIQDPAFQDRLLGLLAPNPACRAGRVVAEMTETAEVENLEEAANTVQALKSIGVAFCLDDFGAGSADIRVLRALPADHVKLDGSFVPGVTAGGRERAFVSGVIDIARAAGATVTAERVETEAEAEAMEAVGATYGQGWLLGKAAPLPTSAPSGTAGRRSGERESWG